MYEQACMATPKDKLYEKMLETIVDYNDHNDAPFSNDKLGQAISPSHGRNGIGRT